MTALNLALRFLLELVGVAAVAYAGWQAVDAFPGRLVAAVAAAAVLVATWAVVVAPKARNPIAQPVRVLIGSALLLGVAVALAGAGATTLAVVFAVAIVVNTGLLVAAGPEGVRHADRDPDPSHRP